MMFMNLLSFPPTVTIDHTGTGWRDLFMSITQTNVHATFGSLAILCLEVFESALQELRWMPGHQMRKKRHCSLFKRISEQWSKLFYISPLYEDLLLLVLFFLFFIYLLLFWISPWSGTEARYCSSLPKLWCILGNGTSSFSGVLCQTSFLCLKYG